MKKHFLFRRYAVACAVAGALVIASSAGAAVIPAQSTSNEITAKSGGDGTGADSPVIDNAGSTAYTSANLYVGGAGTGATPTGFPANERQAVSVLVFQLPALAAGEAFDSATLKVVTTAGSTPSQNIDVYGLGFRNANTLSTIDYFVGALDSTDATLLTNDFLAASSSTASGVTLSTSGTSTSIASYLNQQIANGAVAGSSYVFLRLNMDVFDTGSARLQIGGPGHGTASNRPVLEYTTAAVPEPSAFILAGPAIALLARRRRNG